MNWNTIRLELAGTRDFPTGSVGRAYLIRVPLNDNGSIDETAFAREPQKATVRRFWSSDPDERGHLVRVGGKWALRCHGKPDRLLSMVSALKLGEAVAVTGSDGVALPFRVTSIRRLG
jgi:hypothetical protein